MLGQRTFVVSDNYIRQRKARDRFEQSHEDQEIALSLQQFNFFSATRDLINLHLFDL